MLKFNTASSLIRSRNVLPFVLAVGASAALVACGDGGSASAPVTVTVANTPPPVAIASKAQYQVVLLNALDGSLITDELNVTFTGDATLVDSEGKSLNGKSIKTTSGLVALGADFTGTKREFSVLAGNRVIGWTETGTRVVGDANSSGTTTVELKLLNNKNAAAITADTKTAISSTVREIQNFNVATTVAAIPKTVLNAEGASEVAGGASLTIPAATRAVDPSTGAAITTTGALTISTTKFSNSEPNSLAAFPGGFATSVTVPTGSVFSTNPVAAAGGAGEGTFITGGFAQFNVTDSTGKALTQFDKPLAVSIDLPKSSLGANGEQIVVGSKYPVWSFVDATGEWKFEKEGTVTEKTPVDPSNFSVAFETNHLSSWNLDFYTASCTGRVTLNRGADTRPLRVVVIGTTGQRFSRTLNNVRDSVQTLFRAPAGNNRAIVQVFAGTTLVGSTTTPTSLCNTGITVPLTLPAPQLGNVDIDVTESCPNGTNRRALPTFTYLLQSNWDSKYTTTTGTVARASFGGKQVGTATAYVFNKYTGGYSTQTVSVPLNSTVTAAFNFPNVSCSTVTGSGSSGG